MINPNGKEPCYDGAFFHPNQPFNQGNFFTWSEEDFLNGCQKAIEKVRESRINTKGLEIQQKYKYSDTYNKLINLCFS